MRPFTLHILTWYIFTLKVLIIAAFQLPHGLDLPIFKFWKQTAIMYKKLWYRTLHGNIKLISPGLNIQVHAPSIQLSAVMLAWVPCHTAEIMPVLHKMPDNAIKQF